MAFEIRGVAHDNEILETATRDTYRQATRERSRMLKSGRFAKVTMLEYAKPEVVVKRAPKKGCLRCHGTGWWIAPGYDAEQFCACQTD